MAYDNQEDRRDVSSTINCVNVAAASPRSAGRPHVERTLQVNVSPEKESSSVELLWQCVLERGSVGHVGRGDF
jgi:hypothetical protein